MPSRRLTRCWLLGVRNHFHAYHSTVLIDRAGKSTPTTFPPNSTFTTTASRKLFNSSTTYPPSEEANDIARTPFTPPEVPTRTAPGRTNLLKCAKYQYVPV